MLLAQTEGYHERSRIQEGTEAFGCRVSLDLAHGIGTVSFWEPMPYQSTSAVELGAHPETVTRTRRSRVWESCD